MPVNPSVNATDQLAAHFRRINDRLASLERASSGGGGGGTPTPVTPIYWGRLERTTDVALAANTVTAITWETRTDSTTPPLPAFTHASDGMIVPVDGIYEVSAWAQFTQTTDNTGRFNMLIRKNAAYVYSAATFYPATNLNTSQHMITYQVPCVAGDKLSVHVGSYGQAATLLTIDMSVTGPISATGPTGATGPAGPPGGITDHGLLTGLGDDDHPQYLTNARGDALFLTPAEGNAAYAPLATMPQFLSQSVTAISTPASTAESATCLSFTMGPFPVAGTVNISGVVNGAAGVVGDVFNMNLKNGGSVVRVVREQVSNTTNQATVFPFNVLITVAASGSVTITMTFARVSGTGIFTTQAGSILAVWFPS
jgi:hypothetical protein